MANKKYDLAKQSYQWVIAQGKNKSLVQVARIRLAKIYLYQKQYDKALSVLAKVNDNSYLPMVAGVRGDIYAAQGNKQKARDAFVKAESGLQKLGVDNPLLKLKISSL